MDEITIKDIIEEYELHEEAYQAIEEPYVYEETSFDGVEGLWDWSIED